MKRSPMPRRAAPMKRTPFPRAGLSRAKRLHPAGKNPGFDDNTKSAVWHRSQGRCEVRAPGCRQTAGHFHHRQLRRAGDHTAVNCLHVCDVCHLFIHDHPAASRELGWIVSQWQDPAHILWIPYPGE